MILSFLVTCIVYSLVCPVLSGSSDYFQISCIDDETKLGVPLVLLRTGDYVEHYSDSAGVIAFFEPGLMGQPVFFSVLADGYAFLGGQQYPPPYDNGIVLNVTSGGSTTIELHRTQPAMRMYRLTGAGLYRDSILVGAPVPPSVARRALLDRPSGSIGQDSVQIATYRGSLLWFFGDTVCPRSARQNNCHASGMYSVGAKSCIPAAFRRQLLWSSSADFSTVELSTVEDSVGDCNAAAPPALEYYASFSPPDFHHPKPMAPIAPLAQNTWLGAMTVLDAGGPFEALYCNYYKNPGDGGGSGRQGMAKWDDDAEEFRAISLWPANSSLSLSGAQTVQILSPSDRASGYVYYAGSFVFCRVRATSAAMGNYSDFQHFVPPTSMTMPGSGAQSAGHWVSASAGQSPQPVVLRLRNGRTAPTGWGGGSVNWNPWTKTYVFLGTGGVDYGVYVGFAERLEGPWVNGSRVAAHELSGSSCYNGVHFPHMDLEGGRVISFACTYTAMWSNLIQSPNLWSTCLFGLNSKQNCAPVVPRYEYNNLIYRVDLGKL